MTRKEIKIIALSASGQIIEFYDFTMFVLLANVISNHFFTGSVYAKFMYLFGVFALGYFARPIGGIIFGHFGDTRGRKKTFITTILIISIATLAMGLIPSYKSIGIAAPIILIILRIIQGFSLGGELPGAISFVDEYMPEGKKTFALSFIEVAVMIGVFLASITVFILYYLFNHSFIVDYGWRIPFILGGIFGLIICILRGKMSDTPVFEQMVKNQQILKIPIKELFRKNLRNCILGVCVELIGVFYAVFVLTLPALLTSEIPYYSHEYISFTNSIALVVVVLVILPVAYMIDKFKWNIYLFFTSTCFIIVAIIYPLFLMLGSKNNSSLFWAYMIFGVTYGLLGAVFERIFAKLFPPIVKYSGVAIVINIGIVVSVGIVPLVTTYALKIGGLYAIAFGLMGVMFISAVAGMILYFYPPNEKKLKEWEDEIKKIYDLDKKYDKEKLTVKELEKIDIQFKTFTEKVINFDGIIETTVQNLNSDLVINSTELIRNDVEIVPFFTSEQQDDLYQKCKFLLKNRPCDLPHLLSKYKELLRENQNSQYYASFYTKLLIKEDKAINNKTQLTIKEINQVIKKIAYK
jgi:MFS family permease